MKVWVSTIAGAAVLSATVAFAQPEIRGGWTADRDSVRHIYILKVDGTAFTGVYCTACDRPERVFMIQDGRVAGNRIAFSVYHDTGASAPYREHVVGMVGDGEIAISRRREGSDEEPLALTLTRAVRPSPPAPPPSAGGPPPTPRPYVAPGPPEPLSPGAVAGKWISGIGPAAQVFIFKGIDGVIGGLVCGPCDNPYTIAPIEDGRIKGENFIFYTVHEDWGAALRDHGPYRNAMEATVAKGQMRMRGYLDGAPSENRFEMTSIGPLRLGVE